MRVPWRGFAVGVVTASALLAGCTTSSVSEKGARSEVAAVGRALDVSGVTRSEPEFDRAASVRGNEESPRPNGLAELRADSPESDFVRFALHRHANVRAAYFDWKASVDAIAPARALPDPQITFQADIARTLMSLMPGLMFEVMTPGKRDAMAREATADSNVAYRAYVIQVVRTAAGVRKAWVELAYAQATDRLYQNTIHAAEQAVRLAEADYATGHGMANFEQQVRFQNLLAEHHSHHAGIAERLAAAKARFKSALGLLPSDPDPVWPNAQLAPSPVGSRDELWAAIQARNPELAQMRAMIDLAVASIEVAKKGGTPDFSAGAMVDLKQNPVLFRPIGTITLPVWRERIRATIAGAEARHDAAVARVTAEQLSLAADLAQMLYMIRESDSMLAYMNETALPNLERSRASAEASVQSGMGSATMIAETQLMAIDMRHERLDVMRDRENAVVDLALLINDVLPEGAPVADGQAVRTANAE